MAATPPVPVVMPQPSGADVAAWHAAIMAAPVEILEAMAFHFTPSALRAARMAERDGLLLRIAVGRQGDATAIAEAVFRDLSRYAASAWRRSDCDREAPANPAHGDLHRFLRLNRGEVPAVRTLRRPFAAVAKKTGGSGHA